MDDKKLAIEHPFITEHSTPLLRGESTGAKKARIAALDWRQQAGALLFLVGLVTLFVGWFQVSGTRVTSDQLTYMVGGGVFGLALLAVGAVCFMAAEHKNDRQAIAALSERIVLLEHGLAGEFDALDDTLQSLAREARASRVDAAR